ncbi:MAG: flagellar biosynthetic protein FliO [Clostridia bacterium]|nr:flagellar biosynthetic protein FliO [Clostridia bacterium]
MSWLKIIVALPIVLILAYMSLKLSRSYMNNMKKNTNIKVIETVPIYHKVAISIVKVGQKYYVLGVSDQNVKTISELSAEEIEDIQEVQEPKWKTDQLPKWIEKIKAYKGR